MHPMFFSKSPGVRSGWRSLLEKTKQGRRRAMVRPRLEALEPRLTPSTYVWTALGDGTTWNDPNNWAYFSPSGTLQQPAVPTPYSNVVFPPFVTLPPTRSTTIDVNSAYLYMPLDSLTIEDSYTFTGNPIAIEQFLAVQKPFSATPNVTTATIMLAGLNLAPGVVVNTQSGSTLQLGSTTVPTGLQLYLEGPLTKSGGGQLAIDTQSVFYSNVATVFPIPITIGGGSIALGTNVNLSGVSLQINATAALVIADNVTAQVQSLFGAGLVDLEGTTAATDQTSLTVAVPVATTDQFGGFIDGIGQFIMGGNGTLTTGTIDFDGAGSIDVAYGTLDVDGSISAGALQVGPTATLGGLGLWNFSGAAVFQPGATFDVTLNGTTPGTQYTQLVDTNTAAGVSLGYSTLAASTGYEFEQGDRLTIISAPLVQGVFQNVVAGRVVLSSGVLFGVSTTGTGVTLAPLQSATTTRLQSSANPSNPGLPVTFTASVSTRTSAVTTGTVAFMQGTSVLATVAPNGNGMASFTTRSLPLGTTAITAVFSGAGGFLGSTSPTLNVVVVPSRTVTSLAGSPDPSILGQPVTLTAAVSGTAGAPVTTGTVTFQRGSQFLGKVAVTSAGTASLSVSSLPVGKIGIQAIYSGSVNDLGSVSSVYKQTVNALPTATTLSIATETLARGRTEYFLVATVVPQTGISLTPTGTVAFRRNGRSIGTARLSGGTAKLVLGRSPPSSTLTFVASFQGGTEFGPSSSPALRY